MRKTVLLGLTLAFFACDDEKEAPDVAASEATAEAEEEAKPATDLDALKASLASVVEAARKGAVERRKACLEAVPKIEAAKAAAPDDKKVGRIQGELTPLCFEMIETQKLVKKLAEPKANVQLSAAFASTFTHKDLKKTYKAAKRQAKRKQDPTKSCAEVKLLADTLGSKKSKKTRKLVKKAMAFCNGRAHLSAARFHLEAAKAAIEADSGNKLVQACVHGVKELSIAPAGKLHDKLEGAAAERCLEAVAMKDMMSADAT